MIRWGSFWPAESLVEYITNKEMSLPDLRDWLQRLDVVTLDISPICIREIQAAISASSLEPAVED